MKIKISKFWLLFAFFLFPLVSRAAFTYTPLEKIPGSESSTSDVTDFYAYLSAIYKFGIWAIGIAALLMITIGGYMYITSAGNNTSMEKAKGVITDAIVGLVLALTAYLLLYIINPDLVKIQRLPIITGNGAPTSAVPGAVTPPVAPPATPAAAGGSCSQIVSGAQAMMNANCQYCDGNAKPPQPAGCVRNSCSGSPSYTDCSDLVDTVYKQAGCSSPGNTSTNIGSKGSAIGDSSTLKAGDVLAVPGHVVICTNPGCTQVIGAAGVGKNIKYSNGSFYFNQSGATVVRASSYCSSC